MIELYHYIHCPFCLRIRLSLGLLDLPYKSIPLGYEDEKTPVELTGVKMLPIAVINGKAMNESLDILKKLDIKGELNLDILDSHGEKIDELLGRLGKPIHNLAMPYWMYTKEFTKESREYFQKKKELKRGPFNELVQKQEDFLEELVPLLKEVESLIGPFMLKQKDFTILDIMLASHLWGLYVVPEFQFSPFLHRYLQMVKKVCNFNYHQDLWDGTLGH